MTDIVLSPDEENEEIAVMYDRAALVTTDPTERRRLEAVAARLRGSEASHEWAPGRYSRVDAAA